MKLFNDGGFVEAEEAVKEVKANRAMLLDVRSSAEFASGHAAGAINVPLDRLAAGGLPDVNPKTRVYIYCHSGNRSAQAWIILRRLGFTNAANIGGMKNWQLAGGSIE